MYVAFLAWLQVRILVDMQHIAAAASFEATEAPR